MPNVAIAVTDVAPCRLPPAHDLAMLAARVALELDIKGTGFERTWELAHLLHQLAASAPNVGPWLSGSGEAVHSALDEESERHATSIAELSDRLCGVATRLVAVSALTTDSELWMLRNFAMALSRAALAQPS